MSASAISYMSASVPLCLKVLIDSKTNRQLVWVYPLFGSILSMLGEKGCGPRFRFLRKAIPVSSHFPVQRSRHHSFVSSNGMFLFLASYFRDLKM